jgi:chromosome segregation protein
LYLKRLELCGFKSFADRTKLEFEPGMMAIVGPNGCGKSNISDAIRWVLGEQSAKAMRGSKMEDIIFNGTDTHKAMGVAEVSLTLADCEAGLGTDYHEITVSRRVYRSGEGEYLLNKTPCRLRDIQRLFMDTGIGTQSYALMEQGRIDRILSARPEDRRAVFEEASGITKFKADKREAMRKLEQTEQNLLRLADIIREVKRQIISLQRQAGKARRYQEVQARLRALDLFYLRDRMAAMDGEVSRIEARRAALAEREEALSADEAADQQRVDEARAGLEAQDRAMEEVREHMAQIRAELERAHETMRINRERISEFEQFSRQSQEEEERARATLEQHRRGQTEQETALAAARERATEADARLQALSERIAAFEAEAEAFTRELQRRRSAQMEQEKLAIRLQQELEETDQRQRGAHQRRARLEVEQAEAARRTEQAETQAAAMDERIRTATARAAELREACRLMRADAETRARREAEAKDDAATVQATMAALDARLDMLARQEQAAEGFAGGARWLLAPGRKPGDTGGRILGALAELVRTDPGHETCLQAALRPWLDAVVVESPAAARAWLQALDAARAGSARLLAAGAVAGTAADGPGTPLLAHVTCAPEARAAIERLLAPVRVVPSLDSLPTPIPEGLVFVTPAGQLATGRGVFEYWMADAEEQNPLARGQLRDELRRQRAAAEASLAGALRTLDTLQAGERTQAQTLAERTAALDEAAREEASLTGERRRIGQDLEQTRRRLETVADEIETLLRGGAEDVNARERLAAAIEESRARQMDLHAQVQESAARQPEIEEARRRLSMEASEVRIDAAGRRRDVEELERRLDIQRQRIGELEGLIADRERGAAGYRARIEELVRATAAAGDQIEPLEQERSLHQTRMDTLRSEREELARGIDQLDHALRTRRTALG